MERIGMMVGKFVVGMMVGKLVERGGGGVQLGLGKLELSVGLVASSFGLGCRVRHGWWWLMELSMLVVVGKLELEPSRLGLRLVQQLEHGKLGQLVGSLLVELVGSSLEELVGSLLVGLVGSSLEELVGSSLVGCMMERGGGVGLVRSRLVQRLVASSPWLVLRNQHRMMLMEQRMMLMEQRMMLMGQLVEGIPCSNRDG